MVFKHVGVSVGCLGLHIPVAVRLADTMGIMVTLQSPTCTPVFVGNLYVCWGKALHCWGRRNIK